MSEENTGTDTGAPTGVAGNNGGDGATGEQVAPWYGDLNESLAPHKTLFDQFKDRDSALKSFADTKAAFSRKTEGMVKLPTADTPEEEVAAFYRSLGVPETADAYEITPPEMPEGYTWNPEAIDASLKEAAWREGVTPKAFSALIQAQAKVEAAQLAEYQAQEEAATAALKTEWGANYDKNVMLATRAAEAGGLTIDNPVLANPDVQRVLANLGAKISEGSLGPVNPAPSGMNAQDEATEIIRNKEHPMHEAYHGRVNDRTQTAKARAHVESLFKKAAGK